MDSNKILDESNGTFAAIDPVSPPVKAEPSPVDRKADFLYRLITGLAVPYYYERSFRMTEDDLLPNRFLLGIGKRHLGSDPFALIVDICGQLGMPASLFGNISSNVNAASTMHFGFEGSETSGLYKVYFEFPIAKLAANPGGNSGNPQLQYLAFKWDVFDCDKSVVTRYFWYPSLSVSEIRERIFQIYSEGDSDISFQIVNDVLDLAAGRVPAEKLQYLEVREEETGRKSFDLNLYDARLQLKDIYLFLSRMRKRYSISPGDFQALYDQIKNKMAGHLAGGVHRNGKDFFNVYYGGIPERDGQIFQSSLAKSGEGATRASDLFEYATDRDPHFNYSLWEYPSAAPPRDKFRAVNLLYQSFELGGMSVQGYGLVETIRTAIGSFQTVFGIKLCDNRLGWEFYFYDYRRRQRKVSISKVLSAIKPIAACNIQPNENLPYFMFSIDIDDALVTGARDIDLVHMYIGNPGSTVSSGISYALQSDSSTMENFYFFFDAKTQLEEAANKIFCSAYIDVTKIHFNRILWPELRDCRTICVANKKNNDCVYFSGINVEQLLFFLKRLDYPQEIVSMVETNRTNLNHLLYDVGIDFCMDDNQLRILKSGYYGVF